MADVGHSNPTGDAGGRNSSWRQRERNKRSKGGKHPGGELPLGASVPKINSRQVGLEPTYEGDKQIPEGLQAVGDCVGAP